MKFISLSAFPKSGVTYLSSLLFFTLFHGANPDEIERRYIVDIHIGDCLKALDYKNKVFFKNHHDRNAASIACPPISKVVYLIRNPVDIMFSTYDFAKLVGSKAASMSLENFSQDWVRSSGSFEGFGTWPSHVRSWLEQDELPTLMVRYLDLVDHPLEQLERIFKFLDLQPSSVAIENAIACSSMGAMRAREEDEFRSQRQGVFYSEVVASGMSAGARFINKSYRNSEAALSLQLKSMAEQNFGELQRKYLL